MAQALVIVSVILLNRFLLVLAQTATDFASEWQDNIWPYRQQTAWDISTDFPYPRTLEYDVEEGTWLRLDVHPISGEIVFDMLGDLYCLASYTPTSQPAQARPILLGVPYDCDPHFSPDGDRLIFRSDAELGVENIWIMPWKGCEAMDVRRPELSDAVQRKRQNDGSLAEGIREDMDTKVNRLTAEGRLEGSPLFQLHHIHLIDLRYSSPCHERDFQMGF